MGFRLLPVVLAAVGCVSSAEHRETVSELSALRARVGHEDEQRAQVKAELSQLDTAYRTASARIEALEQQLKALGLEVGGDLSSARKQLEDLKRARVEAAARADDYLKLANALAERVQRGEIKLEELRGHVELDVSERILFGSGKSALSSAGKQAVREIAKALEQMPKREIQIAGHTDTAPVHGHGAGNWELSTARALSVLRGLLDAGVAGHRLSVAGFGAERPIAPNATVSGRAQNRRIEIILLPPLDEPAPPSG
jgi:chemotaxis protein MotB